MSIGKMPPSPGNVKPPPEADPAASNSPPEDVLAASGPPPEDGPAASSLPPEVGPAASSLPPEAAAQAPEAPGQPPNLPVGNTGEDGEVSANIPPGVSGHEIGDVNLRDEVEKNDLWCLRV
ncbi:MAG: hypothetical protein LBC42_00245 [Puniceicoccales bacterium]|jgi:hypothetical protein|nr:hypothetical protein [Puniceicoccales bacterium]